MGIHDFGRLGQEWNPAQDLIAVIAVLAHDRDLIRRQGAGFGEDLIGNRHLTDIVQKRAACDHVNLTFGQAHGPRDGDSESRDPPGVTFGFSILQIEGSAERLQSNVIGTFQVSKSFFQLIGTSGHQ